MVGRIPAFVVQCHYSCYLLSNNICCDLKQLQTCVGLKNNTFIQGLMNQRGSCAAAIGVLERGGTLLVGLISILICDDNLQREVAPICATLLENVNHVNGMEVPGPHIPGY